MPRNAGIEHFTKPSKKKAPLPHGSRRRCLVQIQIVGMSGAVSNFPGHAVDHQHVIVLTGSISNTNKFCQFSFYVSGA
jgi:hypothetical protein